jgi:cytochrome c oxidase subunit II
MAMASTRRRDLLAAAGACALAPVALLAAAAPTERVIPVVAKKFEFMPNEIHVGLGETVVFQLSAPEVPMGFNLADFKLRADIVPGKGATLRFTADRAGSFVFLCDVFCGSGHEDMSGTLIVA